MEQAPRTPSDAGRAEPTGPRKSPAARHLALLVAVLVGLSRTQPADGAEYTFSWSHPRPQGNALHGAAFEDASIGYAVGDRGVVLRTTDGGASWTLVDLFPEFSADLEDLVVLGPGDLLAVGAAPGIFRSTDAGATWTAVTNPSTARLMDVEIVTGTTLSAVGENGQVLRSTDSGATWTMLTSPGGDPREQLWLDASNGYVLGAFRARRTTDGGQTWAPLAGITDNEVFNEAFFTDAQHGFILSDFKIWKSTDAGAPWSGTQPPGLVVYLGNAVVLGPQHFLIVSTVEGASIYETTDGGATWSFALDSGAGGFHDFDRLADGTLLTVSTEGDVFRSTDDGATWANAIEAAAPPRYVIGALGVSPTGKGAAGTTGTPGLQWYHTEDGGAHWAIQPSGPAIAFAGDIAWWDGDRGIGAGDYGKVWRTTDGGLTWGSATLPNVPINGRAWHLSLPAAGIAFAAVNGHSESRVYRTTNYGASWEERSSGIPSGGGLSSVSFPTTDLGFACGYFGSLPRMYKTTDGGASWSAMGTTGLASWPVDMHWHDSQVGIVTSYAGSPGIYRTTNGGASWANVWPRATYDLSFSDPLHGAAGVQAFGAQGVIYVTEDGGATWDSLPVPAAHAGTAITAVPDGFLVAGAAGVIVRATRVLPVGVGGVGGPGDPGVPAGAESARRVLFARTPVGPRIELDFALAAPGPAELAIYDLSGRRVAVLARGEFPGEVTMRAVWEGARDAGGRASAGVYFVRLVSAGEARAVKVTLLR